jgi:glycine/sarcosine N-methyltransferase
MEMYDEFAADYDRFVNWTNRLNSEIPFIQKSLENDQGSHRVILDAACGTGMHALELAKNGFEVTGADLSPEMILKARRNALTANLEVRFEAVGFGSLASYFGKDQFDGLLCLGNSLPHLLTLKNLQAALHDFADCLRPGGLMLIQNRNFDEVMRTRNRWMEPQVWQEDEQEWVYQRFYDFEPDGIIRFNIVRLHRKEQSVWEPNVISTRLRPILCQELCDLLGDEDFSEIQTFGSLIGDPFDPSTSGNLVVRARKK